MAFINFWKLNVPISWRAVLFLYEIHSKCSQKLLQTPCMWQPHGYTLELARPDKSPRNKQYFGHLGSNLDAVGDCSCNQIKGNAVFRIHLQTPTNTSSRLQVATARQKFRRRLYRYFKIYHCVFVAFKSVLTLVFQEQEGVHYFLLFAHDCIKCSDFLGSC